MSVSAAGREPELSFLAGYRPPADRHDELFDRDGSVRPQWSYLVGALHALGAEEFGRRAREARRLLRESGVTYNVYDDPQQGERPWPLDPIPVLITSEDVGRPAENYEYYAGVHSLYLTDLARWRISVVDAVFLFLVAEQEPYLLLPRGLPEREEILAALRGQFLVELVADVPPQRNYDYFVASAFHGGVPLELWRVR